jgi:pyruvate dehydrogenase E2 component (dihydrolipoamide acetyltransferase)
MPIEILMPALSPTMTEGNLVKWLKKEGESVKAGDILAEIETDKATMEVEAVDEGILGKIVVPGGTEQVKVNQLIALVLEEGEDPSALEKAINSPATSTHEKPSAPPPPAGTATAHRPAPALSGARVFASPLARRIAENSKVNLASLKGTGPHGRIVKADVEQALAQGPSPSLATASVQLSGYEPAYEVIAPSAMRKVIAKRLVEAKQTVPHFYLTVDCELDLLLKARAALNTQAGQGGNKLSVNDFVIKACAMALKQVPEANASWVNDQIYQYKSADIAVAVAIDGGLITPVIRQAEDKGLTKVSSEMKDLASKARAGKLKPEEFQGGTFTLSNLGMYGVKSFSAIINPPQGCILAVGQGEERAVVKGGALAIATIMTCTLSSDHRVVDGAVGAQFLKVFKEMIENPVVMML